VYLGLPPHMGGVWAFVEVNRVISAKRNRAVLIDKNKIINLLMYILIKSIIFII
jgi:hypothetical protein